VIGPMTVKRSPGKGGIHNRLYCRDAGAPS
jgi:hypothetical protein